MPQKKIIIKPRRKHKIPSQSLGRQKCLGQTAQKAIILFKPVIRWFPLKDTIKKMNWQTTDWETFALHISDIKFEARIYTELL